MLSWYLQILVEGHLGSDPILHEAAMNKIGTLGDLATGVFEVVLVGMCMGCGIWLEDYRLVGIILSGGVLGISIAMLLLSLSLVAQYGPTLVDKSGEDLAADLRRESITSIASNAPNNQEAWREVSKYFATRVEYFMGDSLLTNVCTLSMVSSCFEYLFDGPVSTFSPSHSLFLLSLLRNSGYLPQQRCLVLVVFLSTPGTEFRLIQCSLPSGQVTLARAALSHTQHGLCGGAVDFILMQAFLLQLLYLLGGSVYFSIIMRMHPGTYYGKVFPVVSVAFMLTTVTPWLPVPEIAAAAIISTVTVVSYYLSIYNSYMLSGASRAEYFGFVQGLYSIAGMTCLHWHTMNGPRVQRREGRSFSWHRLSVHRPPHSVYVVAFVLFRGALLLQLVWLASCLPSFKYSMPVKVFSWLWPSSWQPGASSSPSTCGPGSSQSLHDHQQGDSLCNLHKTGVYHHNNGMVHSLFGHMTL